MFETAIIDALRIAMSHQSWALEAAQNLSANTIQVHCLNDEPDNTTKGYTGQRNIELIFTCYAANSISARSLCRQLTSALRTSAAVFGGYTVRGFSLEGETGGFDKGTNLYYRDFTYNATYQEP